MIKERIVSEISKSYVVSTNTKKKIISNQFEELIKFNKERGFELESWQMNSTVINKCVNETIVAVFVKE